MCAVLLILISTLFVGPTAIVVRLLLDRWDDRHSWPEVR